MPELIAIPAELRRPHPSITATKNEASGVKPREDGRIEIGPRKGIVRLVVSREQLRRALLVLHAIFQEAQRRGWEITAIEKSGYGDRAGAGDAIRGHPYTIEITELTDQIPLTEAELEAWRQQEQKRHRFSWEKEPKPPKYKHVANGKLRVSLPSRWHGARSNWSEGPRARPSSRDSGSCSQSSSAGPKRTTAVRSSTPAAKRNGAAKNSNGSSTNAEPASPKHGPDDCKTRSPPGSTPTRSANTSPSSGYASTPSTTTNAPASAPGATGPKNG